MNLIAERCKVSVRVRYVCRDGALVCTRDGSVSVYGYDIAGPIMLRFSRDLTLDIEPERTVTIENGVTIIMLADRHTTATMEKTMERLKQFWTVEEDATAVNATNNG